MFAFLLLTTGCRRAEALALNYEDIDFKNDVIHITKSVTWEHSVPELKLPKTEKGFRDVFLVPYLKDILSKKKKGLLFPSSKGNLMTECQYTIAWHKYCKESGLNNYAEKSCLSPITAHCLRHNYATILNEAGVDTNKLCSYSAMQMKLQQKMCTQQSQNEKTNRINNLFQKNLKTKSKKLLLKALRKRLHLRKIYV